MDNRYPVTSFNSDHIAAKLDAPVFQEVISKRSGRGNTTLSYLRGDIIADQLNAIFGPLGWDLRAAVPVIDHWEGEKEINGYNNQEKKIVNMHTVQVMTQMTLRIKSRSTEDSDTIFTQTGIGYGEIETTKNRKEVVGMALKGAETDGLKRCASLLGRAMGMFLTGTGSQDEIDYAHNGKNADITKCKKMRSDRLRSASSTGGGSPRLNEEQSTQRHPGNRSETGQQEDRRDNRAGAAKQRQEPQRNERQDDRSSGSQEAQRSQNSDRQQEESRSGGQQQERQQTQSSGSASAPTKGADKKPESSAAKQGADGGGKDKVRFDLDRLPVTGDDQIEFSKEVLARLDEFNQSSDKEKFLKTHYNTIKNLDSKYRRRLIERLAEQKIDFEALGAK